MAVRTTQRLIRQRLAAGEPFAAVEHWIESLHESEELRDALWLYAWLAAEGVEPGRETEPVAP